jgi:hypothetical protein
MTKKGTIVTDYLEQSTTELKLTCPITDGLKRTPPLSTNSEMQFKRYNFRRVKGYYLKLGGIIYRAEKYQDVPRELRYNVVPHIRLFEWYFYKVDVRWQTMQRMKTMKKQSSGLLSTLRRILNLGK